MLGLGRVVNLQVVAHVAGVEQAQLSAGIEATLAARLGWSRSRAWYAAAVHEALVADTGQEADLIAEVRH